MPHLFLLLVKINLVLILFAAAYYFVLRRLTFYVINRIFLAFGILFSTVYPFIDLTDFLLKQRQLNQQVVVKLNERVGQLMPDNLITQYWGIISTVFFAGVLVMAFRLCVQFISLYRMHKKSKQGSVANYPVRILDEPVSPFSFWQTVYINPKLHQENELQTILEHEHIHVREWHSLDIIMAELSVVFYWFNPGVWLMKKAVKENLEFITDEKILKKGVDKKTYQYSLLDVGNLSPAVAIVNNFNLSDLKKRIQMMNVKRSSKLNLSRYVLILPVLLLITLAFTVTKKDIKKQFAPLKQALVKAQLISNDSVDLPSKTLVKVRVKILKPAAKKNQSDSTVFVKLKFFKADSSGNVKDSSDPVAVVDHERLRTTFMGEPGVVISRSFTYRSNDSLINGGVKVQGTGNVRFKRTPGVDLTAPSTVRGELVVAGYATKKLSDTSFVKGNTIYRADGKKMDAEDLKKIDPDNIKSISVAKPSTNIIEITVVGKRKVD